MIDRSLGGCSPGLLPNASTKNFLEHLDTRISSQYFQASGDSVLTDVKLEVYFDVGV